MSMAENRDPSSRMLVPDRSSVQLSGCEQRIREALSLMQLEQAAGHLCDEVAILHQRLLTASDTPTGLKQAFGPNAILNSTIPSGSHAVIQRISGSFLGTGAGGDFGWPTMMGATGR